MVVDVANSPSFEDAAVLKFFETAGKNLLAAEERAGVKHHLGVVGGRHRPAARQRLPARQGGSRKSLIKNSPIPYTILRSTQFFEFIGRIPQASADGKSVRVSSAMFQPIVSDDVRCNAAPN